MLNEWSDRPPGPRLPRDQRPNDPLWVRLLLTALSALFAALTFGWPIVHWLGWR